MEKGKYLNGRKMEYGRERRREGTPMGLYPNIQMANVCPHQLVVGIFGQPPQEPGGKKW
jgi:hypothetical protein